MALIVEDGTGLPDAQTYVSEDVLAQFAADRGITLSKSPSVLLTLAMDYLESRKYAGFTLHAGQALQFPRQEFGVPPSIKKAQLFLAVIADKTELTPIAPTMAPQSIKRRRVEGAIDIEYADPVLLRTAPEFPIVDTLLAGYVAKSGGFGYAVVSRL